MLAIPFHSLCSTAGFEVIDHLEAALRAGLAPTKDSLGRDMETRTQEGQKTLETGLGLRGSESQVLEWILPGDPLGLADLLCTRLRQRALFLDLDRLSLRLYARVARRAAWRNPQGNLRAWLLEQVDKCLDQALMEERASLDDWSCPSGGVQVSASFAQLARPLGLDPHALRLACVRFHGLATAIREAFFLLVVEGRSLDHASQQESLPAPQLARHARLALDVFQGPKTVQPRSPLSENSK